MGCNCHRFRIHIHVSRIIFYDSSSVRPGCRAVWRLEYCSYCNDDQYICARIRYCLLLPIGSQSFGLIPIIFHLALGPLFLGPLSEIYGRAIVLQSANIFFLSMSLYLLSDLKHPEVLPKVWNIACGFAQNTGMFLAFRFLAGLGGSAPLSVRVVASFSLETWLN